MPLLPEYIPVPVELAREIAEAYAKCIVIIAAWDEQFGQLHITTYGASPEQKAWAASGGDIVRKALGAGARNHTVYQDYRLEAIKQLSDVLKATLDHLPTTSPIGQEARTVLFNTKKLLNLPATENAEVEHRAD